MEYVFRSAFYGLTLVVSAIYIFVAVHWAGRPGGRHTRPLLLVVSSHTHFSVRLHHDLGGLALAAVHAGRPEGEPGSLWRSHDLFSVPTIWLKCLFVLVRHLNGGWTDCRLAADEIHGASIFNCFGDLLIFHVQGNDHGDDVNPTLWLWEPPDQWAATLPPAKQIHFRWCSASRDLENLFRGKVKHLTEALSCLECAGVI